MLFKEVVGHNELKRKFINDVKNHKVSHAHLFLGKLGYGNLPLALAFSQYLMCENRNEEDSCGECNACKKVKKLEHPDFHFSFPTVQSNAKTSDLLFPLWRSLVIENPYLSIDDWIIKSDEKGRAPIISVHQSVEIIKKLTLKSFEGGYKVSLIWMAEKMNISCANKLLKIIEEPPKDTVFILIAESEDTILPTILSRTQITKIKSIKDEDLIQYLKSKKNVSNDLVESIAYRSEGDISLALELINTEDSENFNFNRFVELMRVTYKKDVLSMLKWAEETSKLGVEEQKQFIKYALYILRQSLMKNYTEEQLMTTSSEETEFLNKFSRFITGNNIMEFNQLFSDAHYSIERNAQSRLLFTNISFEVMRYIRRA